MCNLYIYIYKTEAYEVPTIFHVSTILKKKTFLKLKKKTGIIKKEKKKHPKISNRHYQKGKKKTPKNNIFALNPN